MVANAEHAFCEQLIDCKSAKDKEFIELELRCIAMYWDPDEKAHMPAMNDETVALYNIIVQNTDNGEELLEIDATAAQVPDIVGVIETYLDEICNHEGG